MWKVLGLVDTVKRAYLVDTVRQYRWDMAYKVPRSPTDSRPNYTVHELTNSYANRVQRHLQMLEASRRNLQEDTEKACQQVRQATLAIKTTLAAREENFIHQLKKHEAEVLQQIESSYREAEAISTNSLCSHVTGLQLCDPGATTGTDQDVHERLRIFETTSLKAVSWTASFNRKQSPSPATIDDLLGTLYTSHRMMNTTVANAGDVDFTHSGHARGMEQVKLGDPFAYVETQNSLS